MFPSLSRQGNVDRLAIGLSGLCLVHCVASAVLVMVLSAAGGVLHAYYKNRQIQTAREIDAIERRIGQYQLDIQTTRYRTDQRLNRYAMAERLKENSSSLRPIPMLVVEEVDPVPPARNSVASAVP